MTEPAAEPGILERLQKIIAAAGIASRRKAEELIAQGRVQVNGQIVTELGTKADPSRDHIRVDGKLLHGPERHRYFVLNKPKGYVTTARDPEGRPTVAEFFQGPHRAVGAHALGERLFPVGRLDFSSEGLLLMTNDGELANALTRAAARVEKTYLVKVSGQPSESAINQLRHGVMIDRGTQIRTDPRKPRPGRHPGSEEDRPARRAAPKERIMTAPARIRLLREGENPWYEMILIEGRNREIRKMFEEIGHHVEKIRRVGYGPLVLDLEPGRTRELAPDEVEALRRAAVSGARAPGVRQPRPSAAKLARPSRPAPKRRSPARENAPSRSQSARSKPPRAPRGRGKRR